MLPYCIEAASLGETMKEICTKLDPYYGVICQLERGHTCDHSGALANGVFYTWPSSEEENEMGLAVSGLFLFVLGLGFVLVTVLCVLSVM